MAFFIQQSLRAVGVTVEVKEVSFSAFWDSISRRGTVPMSVFGWNPDYDDPRNALSVFNADNIHDDGSLNHTFYANARVQQLFREADMELDPTRRFELFREIERQVVQDVPVIFLVHANTEMVIQPWVKGFVPNGFWPTARLEHCWIEH